MFSLKPNLQVRSLLIVYMYVKKDIVSSIAGVIIIRFQPYLP